MLCFFIWWFFIISAVHSMSSSTRQMYSLRIRCILENEFLMRRIAHGVILLALGYMNKPSNKWGFPSQMPSQHLGYKMHVIYAHICCPIFRTNVIINVGQFNIFTQFIFWVELLIFGGSNPLSCWFNYSNHLPLGSYLYIYFSLLNLLVLNIDH